MLELLEQKMRSGRQAGRQAGRQLCADEDAGGDRVLKLECNYKVCVCYDDATCKSNGFRPIPFALHFVFVVF